MNIYNEIFINFDQNLIYKEEINVNKYSVNTINRPFDLKPKGFIFSNAKYIIFG